MRFFIVNFEKHTCTICPHGKDEGEAHLFSRKKDYCQKHGGMWFGFGVSVSRTLFKGILQ